jgi:hypothetical protein
VLPYSFRFPPQVVIATAWGFPMSSSHALCARFLARVRREFKIQNRKEGTAMKATLALLGAVGVLAYAFIQVLVIVLHPLFNALAGKLH